MIRCMVLLTNESAIFQHILNFYYDIASIIGFIVGSLLLSAANIYTGLVINFKNIPIIPTWKLCQYTDPMEAVHSSLGPIP